MEHHSRLMYALKDLSPNDVIDFKIANQIIEYINNKYSPSLKELSKTTFVSNATINRFCKRIKISGFKELKSLINLEIAFSNYVANEDMEGELPDFFGKIGEAINETWENNYVAISELLKIAKIKHAKIHILTTNNYFDYARILQTLIIKQNNYVTIFNEKQQWKQSINMYADFIIAITYSVDRKMIVEMFEEKQNINKQANYILIASLNPFHKKEDNIFFFKMLGENKKFAFPNIVVRNSLNSIIDMIEFFFSKR